MQRNENAPEEYFQNLGNKMTESYELLHRVDAFGKRDTTFWMMAILESISTVAASSRPVMLEEMEGVDIIFMTEQELKAFRQFHNFRFDRAQETSIMMIVILDAVITSTVVSSGL